MAILHPSRALRAKCLLRPTTSTTTTTTTVSAINPSPANRRALSVSPLRLSAGAHEDHYDPPSGWLWGVPPGEKYKKEGWENMWIYGFFGSLGLAVVAYAYKPDTS